MNFKIARNLEELEKMLPKIWRKKYGGRIIVIDGTSNAEKATLCENIEKNIQNVAIIQSKPFCKNSS